MTSMWRDRHVAIYSWRDNETGQSREHVTRLNAKPRSGMPEKSETIQLHVHLDDPAFINRATAIAGRLRPSNPCALLFIDLLRNCIRCQIEARRKLKPI